MARIITNIDLVNWCFIVFNFWVLQVKDKSFNSPNPIFNLFLEKIFFL